MAATIIAEASCVRRAGDAIKTSLVRARMAGAAATTRARAKWGRLRLRRNRLRNIEGRQLLKATRELGHIDLLGLATPELRGHDSPTMW